MNRKSFLLTAIIIFFLSFIAGIVFLWKNYKVEYNLRNKGQDSGTITKNPVLRICYWDWENEVEKTRYLIERISNNESIKNINANLRSATKRLIEK